MLLGQGAALVLGVLLQLGWVCVCVGTSRLVGGAGGGGEFWIWGGLVLGEVSPCSSGIGCLFEQAGAVVMSWGEQAVVGIDREAETVCMRAGIEG